MKHQAYSVKMKIAQRVRYDARCIHPNFKNLTRLKGGEHHAEY